MEGKAKVALTFALSQGGQLVRRETVVTEVGGTSGSGVVKVGKDAKSHLRVDDDLASRMHAVLEVAPSDPPGQDITLIDLGNEPGTMVNGQRVNKCKIRIGDQIQIGGTMIALEAAAPAELAATAPVSPEMVQAAVAPSAPPPPAAEAAAAAPASNNPFAAPAAGANPFASANPFAGAAAANPFASANPFAGAAAAAAAPMHDVDPNAPPGSYTYQMVKSGPDVNPDEVEVSHMSSLEVRVLWDTNTLHIAHVSPAQMFVVGEEQGPPNKNVSTYFIPSEVLGTTRAPVVTAGGGVVILPRATGWVEVPGQGKTPISELISSGRARQSGNVSGGYDFTLPPGGKLRQELPGGLGFEIAAGNAGKSPPVGIFANFEPGAYLYSGLSFLMHVGILASLAFFMPSMGGDDDEAIDRDQLLRMQHLLNAQAEREQEERETEQQPDQNADQKEGGTGTRAKGEEGSMGNPNTNKTGMKYGVQGPQDNQDPHLARQAALKEAADFGMIGLLSSAAGADPNAPTAPWGREDSLGNDPMSARGNMWGDAIGDSFGAGGLGLSGVGEGGGGRGEGIGLGNIGTLGHGAGTGTGQGFGNGHGRLGGAHQTRSPSLRQGNTTVNGRLPPEVIQRIVRQNFGRFRLCYENGLKQNPSLTGRVSVKFVIGREGDVQTAQDGGSELPDQGVVGCVVRGFQNLSFPNPEGGIVTVVYPIIFSPGDQ